MSIENSTTQLQEEPKVSLTDEEIQNTKSNMEMSKKLRQVNDVLQVLDFPDNQEEAFRVILKKQEPKTLQELASKSKKEILTFLVLENKKEVTKTVTEENIKGNIIDSKKALENQKIQTKLSKIKAVFTPTVLENNPDIAEKLEILEGLDEPLEKEKILQEILQILKNPGRLKAIINNLGGANKSNPLYVEFKSALLGVDSDFKKYFEDLEKISGGVSFDSDEVIESVEGNSGGMIDIDLNANPPISKMSLIGSNYSFDKELDKKALSKLQAESKEVLGVVQNGFTILKGLYKPFDTLLKQIRGIWGQSHFKEKLKAIVNAFSKDIFDDLGKMYKDMGIKSDTQINQNDIDTLADSHSASDLKSKIETIKAKLIKIKEQLTTKKSGIFKEYQADMKQLIKRDSTEKKRELEVLQFMKSSGFDLFPKEITNRLIKELMSNTLIIPNLPLSLSNINLKNGNFGESSIFINKENGLNIEAKRNLVKFVNKMISGNINEPLVVESIVNGVSVIDPLEMKHKILKAGISNGLGWKYSKIIENLRTK